ncbi:MAG: outer membrane beta-barrel protein [Hyphomicrobiaceae bacterium]|nr:porin family protein [Hyphomicrobiaceae bacterium]
MRKITLAAATIATLATATATAAQDRAPIWTGLYLGAHIGGASSSWKAPDIDINTNASAIAGGVFGGGNYQVGSAVFGAELDHTFVNMKKSWTDGVDTITLSNGGLTSIRARAGFLLDPRLLAYGTLGWGRGTARVTFFDGINTLSESKSTSGLVYGGGIEYKMTNNVSLRGEVLRFNNSVKFDDAVERVRIPVTLYRAGIAYQF